MPKHQVFSFTLTSLLCIPCVRGRHAACCTRGHRSPGASHPNPYLREWGISQPLCYGTPCAMPRQRSPVSRCFSPQPLPKGAGDFPRVAGNHSNHTPLPIYLATLQPIYDILGLYLYTSILKKPLLVVKTLIKNKAAATLISIHKLSNNCSLKKYISEHKCSSKLLPQKIHGETFLHKMSFSTIGNNNQFSEYFFFNLYKNEWKEHKF